MQASNSRVSGQPQHYGHLDWWVGLDNVLYTVGCLEASRTSVHSSLDVTTKNVSKHSQMSHGRKGCKITVVSGDRTSKGMDI